MPRLIVSTCGISLLANQADQALRKVLTRSANARRYEELDAPERSTIAAHITACAQPFAATELNLLQLARVSAEANGLIRYYDSDLSAQRDHHVLVCTDTYLGEQTAIILEKWLLRYGQGVERLRVPDLQTQCLEDFQLGMAELVRWCAEILPSYRNNGYHIVFNLTGGFKSIQGFMQVLGMFYADESVYIFESSPKLLILPRLPVELNARRVIEQKLPTFRRLAAQLTVSQAECAGIPETLLLIVEGKAALSPWGELIWQESHKAIYAERLHPPISNRLCFSSAFAKVQLSHDRLLTLNERLDQLARCLESGQNYNPLSLGFKKMRTPLGESTYEFNAWADRGAYRGFGHFEGSVFTIDRLDEGRHG